MAESRNEHQPVLTLRPTTRSTPPRRTSHILNLLAVDIVRLKFAKQCSEIGDPNTEHLPRNSNTALQPHLPLQELQVISNAFSQRIALNPRQDVQSTVHKRLDLNPGMFCGIVSNLEEDALVCGIVILPFSHMVPRAISYESCLNPPGIRNGSRWG